LVAALIIWKDSQVWQVTGDPTTLNTTLNYMSLNVGTSSPRSVSMSPQGLYFAGVAGPYFIDPLGTLRALTHSFQETDPDIQTPFVNCTERSRVASAYAGSIYRICIPTVINGQTVTNDYWFDEHRRRWTGPHSFTYDCASGIANYFVITGAANTAKLIKSQSQQDTNTVFTDLGTTLLGSVLSATFPKVARMTEKQVCESTQELSASGGNASYNITAQDEQGNTLGSVSITIVSSGKLWGANIWGDGSVWTNSRNIPHVYTLPWQAPLVFKKMALLITAVASANLQIGTHFSRYQDTGYMNNTSANMP